jgi:hypothetical protein
MDLTEYLSTSTRLDTITSTMNFTTISTELNPGTKNAVYRRRPRTTAEMNGWSLADILANGVTCTNDTDLWNAVLKLYFQLCNQRKRLVRDEISDDFLQNTTIAVESGSTTLVIPQRFIEDENNPPGSDFIRRFMDIVDSHCEPVPQLTKSLATCVGPQKNKRHAIMLRFT